MICAEADEAKVFALCVELKSAGFLGKISLHHEVAIDYQHDYVALIYAESTGRKESYLTRDRSFSRRGAAVT